MTLQDFDRKAEVVFDILSEWGQVAALLILIFWIIRIAL